LLLLYFGCLAALMFCVEAARGVLAIIRSAPLARYRALAFRHWAARRNLPSYARRTLTV
jgi:hypothetical protein